MIETSNTQLSIAMQCEMVNLNRSTYYDYMRQKQDTDLDLKQRIDAIYTKHPVYGSRRVTEILRRHRITINRKRTQRLMREMNIQGIHQKRNLSVARREHTKYPYIAREKPITKIMQVWSTDITYLLTPFGTVYLVAIMDWHSRFIMSWNMSNTMDESLCTDPLRAALRKGTPEIFNTDQGAQFTGNSFIDILLEHRIRPSMDSKGRATDNAQSERFWRTVKWEEIYLYEPQTFIELQGLISRFIRYYNHERPHQSLNYKTPSEVHFDLEKKLFDSDGNLVYSQKELECVDF